MNEAQLQFELTAVLAREGAQAARSRWLEVALEVGARATAILESRGPSRPARTLLAGSWPEEVRENLRMALPGSEIEVIRRWAAEAPQRGIVALEEVAEDDPPTHLCVFVAEDPEVRETLSRSVLFLSHLLAMFHRPSLEIRGIIHDVNGVIAAVLGYAFLLRREENERVSETAALVIRELERASRMMREILGVAPTPPTPSTRADLEEIVHAVRELFAARCQLDHVELSTAIARPVVLEGISTLAVRRCLENLVRNAITSVGENEGGRIRLFVETTPQEVLFGVEDDGPGIDPHCLGRIGQVGFTTRGQSHQGLGLAYVREVSEGQGGRLRIETDRGRTRVYLAWPASMARFPASREP